MDVLVIGGTGALGLPAVKALGEHGHRVWSTARSPRDRDTLAMFGAKAITVDIYDTEALRKAMDGKDAVIRLTTKIPKSLLDMRKKNAWTQTNRLRAVSAQRIVSAAIAAQVHVYITESFYAAYPSSGSRWVTEDVPLDPAGIDTMEAVALSEEQARRFAANGRRGIALRFGGFYGPSNGMTMEIVQMLRKRMLPIIGAGDYYVPSLHIDDAARAIVGALEAPSGAYNVCDDTPRTYADFITGIAAVADAPSPMRLPEFIGPIAMGYPWKWMRRSVRMSNAALKSVTGWVPQHTDAVEGIARIIHAPQTTTANALRL
jgi:nucleoside-diphosphate-sugar epimerase